MKLAGIFLFLVGLAWADHDSTVKPGGAGSKVVEATVDKIEAACIFSEDKLFTRRVAYVESRDGEDPETYKEGYHGGIWQVDESAFEFFMAHTASLILSGELRSIYEHFGINWSTVEWIDLRKPLYSALVMRLTVELHARGNTIPRSIEDQAAYWKANYRHQGNTDIFVATSQQLETRCSTSNPIDIAFALDSSGSVGRRGFGLIKRFVKEVVKNFDIGASDTRVAALKYGTTANVEFNFNTHQTKSALLRAIDNINYLSGSTNTHLALDVMRTQMFTEAAGARKLDQGHPHVAVFITDGKSNQPNNTLIAALAAHDADISILAIGIGMSVDVGELHAIASSPECNNRFLLDDFEEINSLKYAVETKTCRAPIIIGPHDGEMNITNKPDVSQNCRLRIPPKGLTIELFSVPGESQMYFSRDTSPNSAVYSKMITTQGQSDAQIFVANTLDSEEDVSFCNIAGDGDSHIRIKYTVGDRHSCKTKACQNAGTCVEDSYRWRCDCPPGFHGTYCEIVIDHCDPNQCYNGVCINHPTGFTCRCHFGYTGRLCDSFFDFCQPKPCLHGGICETIHHEPGYMCFCEAGFTGTHCQIDIDECASQPCQNGGTCEDKVNGYSCHCAPGYTGDHCQTDVDDCAPDPCQNGACVDVVDAYLCICEPGWTGTNCDTDIDECASDPCLMGICDNGHDHFKCHCHVGWTGVNCDTQEDECNPNPCGYHGDCKPLHNDYECCCHQGWEGKHCEIDIDECASSPCVHGECKDGHNHYSCAPCDSGYAGIHCEIDINECASQPCQNNGECEDQVNGYVCHCPSGWTGTHCEIDIDECAPNPCLNGRCIDEVNRFYCICDAGWTGIYCGTNIDECESSPCYMGTCNDQVNGYTCTCEPGWTGTHCDIDIDECACNPCIHGNCQDHVNGYICICHPGYTGIHCETEINECASDPCLNNGQCMDRINHYICICSPGFTGDHCGIDIDECESDPCVRGECFDQVNSYYCECAPGWTGTHCDCLIDNCASNPCKHGICENGEGTFTCTCMHGWVGITCETRVTVPPDGGSGEVEDTDELARELFLLTEQNHQG